MADTDPDKEKKYYAGRNNLVNTELLCQKIERCVYYLKAPLRCDDDRYNDGQQQQCAAEEYEPVDLRCFVVTHFS